MTPLGPDDDLERFVFALALAVGALVALALLRGVVGI